MNFLNIYLILYEYVSYYVVSKNFLRVYQELQNSLKTKILFVL
jgi:hypothetical protein